MQNVVLILITKYPSVLIAMLGSLYLISYFVIFCEVSYFLYVLISFKKSQFSIHICVIQIVYTLPLKLADNFVYYIFAYTNSVLSIFFHYFKNEFSR